MSITVQPIALPNAREVAIDLHEPGIIRHISVAAVHSRLVELPGVRSSRRGQDHVILHAEVDTAQPKRKRLFALMSPGMEFEPNEDVRLAWCGAAISDAGAVVYVYEIIKEPPTGASAGITTTTAPVGDVDEETRSRLESPVLTE